MEKEHLENEPADSPSPSADYRPLKFVSDQMLTSDSHPYNPMLTSDSHPYNPMLTSDSHPYNPMLTSDSNPLDPLLTSDSHPQSSLIIETKEFFENISKEAQPDNSNVSKRDTGGCSPSLSTHALVDVLGKTVIPLFSFKECAELKEVNCPSSTGMEIINFSTEDSLGHSRNHDRNLDNDGECGAVGDENYGVILVVKPEKDEDTSNIMISNVESIETAVNNNDIKDEIVNKDASCIKTKLDVHKAVSDNGNFLALSMFCCLLV